MDRRLASIVLASALAAGCSGSPQDEGDTTGTGETTSQSREALTTQTDNVFPKVGSAPATASVGVGIGGGASGSALPAGVLAHPRVVSVMWGPNVYVSGYAPEFYQDVVSGPYFPMLASYGVSTGSFAGQKAITPRNGTTAITDAILKDELSKDVQGGVLPAWDANTVYIVHLPIGYTLTDSTGTPQCGYHSQFQLPSGLAAFGVVGTYAPGSLCATKYTYTQFGSQASDTLFAASHEVIEAAVNPYGPNLEVGDPCGKDMNNGGIAWTAFMGTNHAWMVQKPWISSSSSCASLPIPAPITPSAANSGSFAVARAPGNLDAFFIETNGIIYNDYWSGSTWGSTPTTNGGTASGGASIAATARTANNLDIFWIGPDGALWTAFWSGNGWNSFAITVGNFAPTGGNVTAVARGPNNLDVFLSDDTGTGWNVFWTAANGWGATAITNSGVLVAGAGIAAVARTRNNLDVFMLDRNGAVLTAYWAAGFNWNSYEATAAGVGAAGASITATSREWAKLDVFWANQSGNVQNATWADNEQNGANWATSAVPFATGFAPNAKISAVTRQASNLDLFLVGTDGAVYNPFYYDTSTTKGFPNHAWGGEARTTGGAQAPSGSLVASTARTPFNLDAFETNAGARYNTFWSGSIWGTVQIP